MTVATESPICEARNISVAYDAARLRYAIKDVSLTVNAGEVVAILGPSGCGKSTLLRALIGLRPPTTGEVLARGVPLTGMHPGVALVFQTFALYPWLTVRQNIEVALDGMELGPDERRQRITQSIDTIGLEGFEEAYPKELSGGMKQRVGFARALTRGPELLCMDEPFSALDVFTAEGLRSEVYRLVTGRAENAAKGKTVMSVKSVLIITHNIDEAVFLADRVVVLGANPGHIRQIISNPVKHPREYRSFEFRKMVQQLHEVIMSAHLPEEPAAPAVAAADAGLPVPEPIPRVNVAEIFGLMEIVRDLGGQVDVFRLDQMTDYDFGHSLAVIKAGEMLDFLDTPKNWVVLTDIGNQFLDADINGRKALFSAQLQKLGTFRYIMQMLSEASEKRLPQDVVISELAMRLPTQDAEATFETVVTWGRFGELFGFNPEAQTLYLDQPQPATETAS